MNTAPSSLSSSPVGERVALAALVVATVATSCFIPLASWRASPADPCHLAALAALVTVAALLLTRRRLDRGARTERRLSALFLAGMPLVYLSSCLLDGPQAGWSTSATVELAGVPLYGAIAWLGYARWGWLLPAGIALHGVGWDAWHYGRASFVPDWYVVGCLVLDVTMGLYLATRVGRWRRS